MCSDITWLPISLRKGVEVPAVKFVELNNQYGGYYTPGTKVLVIASDEEIDRTDSTIAHEYCHYLQYTKGLKKMGSNIDLFNKYCYNEAIRLYFRTQDFEMEALLFEYKHAPSEVNKFWLKALVLPEYRKFDKNVCM